MFRPYFITNAEKMIAELDQPYILIHEKKLSGAAADAAVAGERGAVGAPLLIIAEDVEGEALATLVVNKLRGSLKVAAVKAPGFGDRRKAMLEDIAILTGGTGHQRGPRHQARERDARRSGPAKTVLIEKENTTIVDGAGKQPMTSRAAATRSARRSRRPPRTTTARSCRSGWRSWPAALRSSRSAAATEVEMKESKDRVDDASACHARRGRGRHRAGRRRGAGTGLAGPVEADRRQRRPALWHRDRPQGGADAAAPDRGECRRGWRGRVRRVLDRDEYNWGLDAQTGEFKDLVAAGIIDPTKVVRTALQNAASVAGLLITTEAMVAERPEKAAPMPAGGMGGMGGGMGGMGDMGF